MAVTIKSPREIELMRKAGEILAQVHEELHAAVHPGMSTLDIDKLGERLIRSHGCIPSFKNYNGYPASICVSVNDEIVHGIPEEASYFKRMAISSALMRGRSIRDTIPTRPHLGSRKRLPGSTETDGCHKTVLLRRY